MKLFDEIFKEHTRKLFLVFISSLRDRGRGTLYGDTHGIICAYHDMAIIIIKTPNFRYFYDGR